MSSTSIFIALILCGLMVQYALGWRQARRFALAVTDLRTAGTGCVSVGVGKHHGRRAYVAVVTDPACEVVTAALAMSGATVLASARPFPELVGARIERLTTGNVGVRSVPLTKAAAQAAGFALEKAGTAPAAR